MHPDTPKLKQAIACENDLLKKLEILHNSYQGQTGYLIACGPSLAEFDPGLLRGFLRDKIVLALKQTLTLLREAVDFHIQVPANSQRFDYDSLTPIVIDEFSPNDPVSFTQPDVMFPKEPYSLWSAVSLSREFDSYVIADNPIRPCGPGTIYELGFYLALHIGLKNLVVLGWDMHSDPLQLQQLRKGAVGCTHFYERSAEAYRLLDEESNPSRGYHQMFQRFQGGMPINTAATTPADDILMTALGSGYFYTWLREQGVNLFVTTDSPLVSPRIPRVELWRTDDPAYLEEASSPDRKPDPGMLRFLALKDLFPREQRLLATDSCFGLGWHGSEKSPDGSSSWRWSGPQTVSHIYPRLDRSAALELHIHGWFLVPGTLGLRVDGMNLPVELTRNGELWEVSSIIPPLPAGEKFEFTRLELVVDRTQAPSALDSNSGDNRKLGFALTRLTTSLAGAHD